MRIALRTSFAFALALTLTSTAAPALAAQTESAPAPAPVAAEPRAPEANTTVARDPAAPAAPAATQAATPAPAAPTEPSANTAHPTPEGPPVSEPRRAARPVRGHLEATIDARRRVVLAFFDESGALRWRAVAWVSDAPAMLATLSMLAGDATEPDDEDTQLAEEVAAPAPGPLAVHAPPAVAPSAHVPAAPVLTAPVGEPGGALQIGVGASASAVRLELKR